MTISLLKDSPAQRSAALHARHRNIMRNSIAHTNRALGLQAADQVMLNGVRGITQSGPMIEHPLTTGCPWCGQSPTACADTDCDHSYFDID